MRYFNILLIICIVASFSFTCSGCKQAKKTSKIVIKHESKFKKITSKKAEPTGIIDLSNGKHANFSMRVGPGDPSSPDFNMVNVKMP